MQPSMTTCNQDSPKPASFIKKAYSGEDLAAAKLGPAWVFSLRFSNQPIDVLNHDIYLYIYKWIQTLFEKEFDHPNHTPTTS